MISENDEQIFPTFVALYLQRGVPYTERINIMNV